MYIVSPKKVLFRRWSGLDWFAGFAEVTIADPGASHLLVGKGRRRRRLKRGK